MAAPPSERRPLRLRVYPADCLDVLPRLKPESVDAVVCDPQYGLAELPAKLVTKALTAWLSGDRSHVPDGRGFMGKDWDSFVPPPAVWDECMRVLKPGGHLLVFGGSRTVDLLGISMRLAGLEIRDTLHWIYGSGFPKSLDVAKAIDKAAGAEREVMGVKASNRPNVVGCAPGGSMGGGAYTERLNTIPATEDAARWDGWGTALKPAHEPIILARKPLIGTVIQNVRAHATGALNVDGCRVVATDPQLAEKYASVRNAPPRDNKVYGADNRSRGEQSLEPHPGGRWPPNILLTHSAGCQPVGAAAVRDYASADGTETIQAWDCAEGCPVVALDGQSGISKSGVAVRRNRDGSTEPGDVYGDYARAAAPDLGHGDTGGSSRFFPTFAWSPEYDVPFMYQSKAGKKERPQVDGLSGHPTVKPLRLVRWLVRLVTPPDGVVLDMFAGTGTTGQACLEEGFRAILCERDPDSIRRIEKRLEWYGDWACRR